MTRPPGEEAPGQLWFVLGALISVNAIVIAATNLLDATSWTGRVIWTVGLVAMVVLALGAWREHRRRNNPEPLASLRRHEGDPR